MPKLTKRFIDSVLPQSGRDVVVWDSELPGFGLRVKPSGRRSFMIQYRSRGCSRRLTLGMCGALLTPYDARRLAIERLADVRRGLDPAEEKRTQLTAPRMTDLFKRYLDQHARPKKKPSTVAADERKWRLHIERRLGAIPVSEVNRRHMNDLHHKLRSKPIMANRVLALLSKMFNLAEKWGWRPDATNPTRHVERYRETRRERYLSDLEMAALGKALRAAESERSELPSALAAIRFLILTGCRRSEALRLRWIDLDLARGIARLPDSKTGPKTIYLNAPVSSLLNKQQRDTAWVFPGRYRNGPLIGLTRPWYRIRKAAGLEDVRLHDLRHTFASVGVGSGSSLPMLGGLLGHTQASTTQRYAHLATEPLQRASDAIGGRIASAMNSESSGETLLGVD